MDAIVEHARERIEKGSKSFAGAARLFDGATRESAYLLYAWCRHADDEIDGQELGFALESPDLRPPQDRLATLEDKTRRALAGDADEPVFQGLARVAARHAIPDRHPLELIEGFRMDVEGRTYRTADDAAAYCYHVAGVVGVMMAMVMGVRDRETLERASDLGIGFQLTNIARDVMADASAGRLYLPGEWLEQAGVAATADAVGAPENRAAVFAVTERLLDMAEAYYQSASYGLSRLPFRAAVAIAAARSVYRDIGAVVRARGTDAWAERAIVSRRRKAWGMLGASASAVASRFSGPLAAAPPRSGLWTMPGLGDDIIRAR